MKKILCIAQSCCDIIFADLPRIPGPGEECYCPHFAIRPGGGANTPINLAQLGADVTFLTGLGDDQMGRAVLSALEHAGVRTMGNVCLPETETAVSAVLSTQSDRSFASYGGTEGPFFQPHQLEQAIREADMVYSYFGYALSWDIPALCEKHGRTLCLDASWCDAEDTPEIWSLLARCDHLKLNDLEARKITGLSSPEEALKKLLAAVRKTVVVTLGEQGSIGMEKGGSLIRQEAIRLGHFRDSCGAGDAYGAGMLYALSRGESLESAMEEGARRAGQCVTWLGGNIEMDNSLP